MLIDVRIPLGAGFSSFLNCANAQYETETNQESEVAGTTTYFEHKCDKKEEKIYDIEIVIPKIKNLAIA